MIKEGLKLTYSFGNIEGVRESIKFKVGDIVWVYILAESYRKRHPDMEHYRSKCKIIKVQESNETYGVKNLETGYEGYWYYPTFLEHFEQ